MSSMVNTDFQFCHLVFMGFFRGVLGMDLGDIFVICGVSMIMTKLCTTMCFEIIVSSKTLLQHCLYKTQFMIMKT